MCKQLTTAAAPTPGECRDEGEKNGVPGELEGNGHCIPGSLWLWKIPGKLGQAERDLCAGLKAGIAPGRFARGRGRQLCAFNKEGSGTAGSRNSSNDIRVFSSLPFSLQLPHPYTCH